DAAAGNFRHALHVVRRVLDPTGDVAASALVLRGDRILLLPSGHLWIDVEEFERAAATARQTRDPADLDTAIGHYSGDLLPDDRYEDWATARRQSLRETYLALLLDLARAREERGELTEATAALRRVVAQEPAHEEAHAGLMRLYARAG